MNRRKYLAVLGMASIAGCSGAENGGQPATDTTTQSKPTATDSATENPTETATDSPTPTEQPPSFEVVEYNVPSEVEIGEEFTISISVKNTGGQAGEFAAPLYLKTPETSWTEQGTWDYNTIQPGKTATLESDSISFSYTTRYEIRIGDSSKTGVIQVVSAQLGWGQEYQTPPGYRIRVDKPTLQSSYEYKDWEGNIAEREPENGGKWVFVNVWVKNETGQAAYSPLASEFPLVAGNSQYDAKILLDDPVNKGEPFEGGELQPGVERSGWIAYAIPDGLTVSDLLIAWSSTTINGEIAVNWSSSG